VQRQRQTCSAEANLEKAQTALRMIKDIRTEQELLARNSLPRVIWTQQIAYQSDKAQVASAKAQIEQAKASLDYAQQNLAYTRIVSPVDGVVISRAVDVGQTVAASFQTPTLFTIAQDLTKMQIDTNVAESDIGVVKVGQGVEFTVDAYPDTTFKGKVWQIRHTLSRCRTWLPRRCDQVNNRDLKLMRNDGQRLVIIMTSSNVLR
jgi:HlyD family secretion protein